MENIWLDVADRVKDLSSKPEKFLEPSDTIFNKTKILAKVLYDAAKLLEDGKYRNVTLPELIIDNFDEEQVWAGVELQNTAWESDFRDKLEKLETLSIRNPDSFNLLRGPSVSALKSKPVEEVESEEEDDDFVFDDDDDGDEEEEEVICRFNSTVSVVKFTTHNFVTFYIFNDKVILLGFSMQLYQILT